MPVFINHEPPVSATTVVNCLSCSSLEVMGVLCPMGLMTLPERRQALKGANAFDRLRGQQPENSRLNDGPCC
jgi:hypothetical protein